MDPPIKFPFPFPPYDIQEDFMRSLFQVLDKGGLGIFESPTGTGKSMSIICGTLAWYLAHEEKRKKDLEAKVKAAKDADDGGDDWFSAAVKKKEEDEERRQAKNELDQLLEKEERMNELRRRRKSVQRASVQKVDSEFDELFRDLQHVQDAVRKELASHGSELRLEEGEEAVILDEYVSDDEDGDAKKKSYFGGDDEEEEKEDFSMRVSIPFSVPYQVI